MKINFTKMVISLLAFTLLFINIPNVNASQDQTKVNSEIELIEKSDALSPLVPNFPKERASTQVSTTATEHSSEFTISTDGYEGGVTGTVGQTISYQKGEVIVESNRGVIIAIAALCIIVVLALLMKKFNSKKTAV